MATNGSWTVVFDDKIIIKQSGDGAGNAYTIDDNAFWATTDFQNIWAIHYGNPVSTDEVEHRDTTPHNSLETEGLDFQQFIDRWDSAHLAKLQADWDADVIQVWSGEVNNSVLESTESEADQIARKGPRPTSYSS